MKQLVAAFPNQLREALQIGQSYTFKTAKRTFSNVLLTGLGGSGIGGSIIQNYVFDKLSIPFLVNKDYHLPAFVGKDTLVIVSSYSGNTEETLMAMNQAIKSGATVVCVTSGGQVAAIAQKKDFDCILVPGGMPPRSCLGYSLVQSLFIFDHFGLLKTDFKKEINAAIKLIETDIKDIQKQAKALAKKLIGKTPILYAVPEFEGVAVRFRQQINENSKMLCWHHIVPEMNHNELVGWREKDNTKAVIFIRNHEDYKRTQARIELNKTIIKKYTTSITELWSKGKTYFERAFYIIHLTDWVSVYLAAAREVDDMEVKVIDFLKGSLAKV